MDILGREPFGHLGYHGYTTVYHNYSIRKLEYGLKRYNSPSFTNLTMHSIL
jgi:hypothetical protein